jgi:hypothetical protein
MIIENLALLPVVILAITSLFLLLSQNWRWSITALAFQYLAIFLMVAFMWPIGLASVKLVAGWMAGALLGSSQPLPEQVEDSFSSGSAFIFRFLAAGLVWILVFAAAPALVNVLPISLSVAHGALLLIGMGLVHLGMTTRPLRVLLGLLTTLSGFEILYAAVEDSILVAGLLAAVTLGLAFIGAYLLSMNAPRKESTE